MANEELMDKIMDDSQLDKVAGGTQAEIHELMYFTRTMGTTAGMEPRIG